MKQRKHYTWNRDARDSAERLWKDEESCPSTRSVPGIVENTCHRKNECELYMIGDVAHRKRKRR
jgi:hypothetical protein